MGEDQYLASPEYFSTAPHEPIVLTGDPGVLRARVPMRNPTGARVRLRDTVVRGDAAQVLSARDAPAMLETVLFPQESRLVTISVATDPHAPPGEYVGELEIGGQVRPFVINITETIDLSVSPKPVVIQNVPGDTQTKVLVLENRGNVPLTIAEIGPVALEDHLFECHALRRTAKAVDENDKNLQKILAEILIQGKKIIEDIGFLRVRNPEIVLQPGEVVSLSLEVRVPDKVDPRGRYTAIVPLYTADVEFLLVPGAARPPAAPDPAAPASTKRVSSKAGTSPPAVQ